MIIRRVQGISISLPSVTVPGPMVVTRLVVSSGNVAADLAHIDEATA